MDTCGVDEVTAHLDCIFPPAISEFSSPSRISLYKNRGRSVDQERRWRQEVEIIRRKSVRQKQFNDQRDIPSQSAGNTEVLVADDKYQCNSWRSCSDQLMLAEWLLFMPPTFEQDYLMKFCPKGRQVLVSASKGSTKVFSRTGKRLMTTTSRLPGGGLGQSDRQNQKYSTLLDCVMVTPPGLHSNSSSPVIEGKSRVEFYVLDVMRFRSTDYSYLTFRERCSWLETYLRDELEQSSEADKIHFQVIPAHSCDSSSMASVFASKPEYDLDGVLFYHQLVPYTPGATPLVTWLKPYMLREWFPNIEIHPSYQDNTPAGYTTYLEDVRSQEELAKREHRT